MDTLKKLDKKFLILAFCIIISPIVFIAFLAIIQSCSNARMNYESYEKKMISASEKYIKSKNTIPKEEGELVKIDLSILVKSGYIKSPEKALKDESCNGSVSVRRNGASIDINDGGFLNYTVSLKCDDYTTATLVSKITSNVVTSDSGLYSVGDEYIFKGNKVNNYVDFFGNTYRIMSIDKDGVMRLIRNEIELGSKYWDNKYNTEVNRSYGKSIYKDSAILSYLINDYKNSKKISKKAKAHIVAYDTCIGKRKIGDYAIDKAADCAEKLPKQVISLATMSDFALASTDPECNSIVSRSCRNYNYLFQVASSTWTSNSVSDNTYEIYFINDGLIDYIEASNYNEYNIVIYIDGNELYNGGKGTADDPYVIN